MQRPTRSCRHTRWIGALVLGVGLGACDEPAVLIADMPLQLEDHLDAAIVE